MPGTPYDSGKLVRKGRLELPRVTPLAPKASASTNSATFAPDKPRSPLYPEFILNSKNLVVFGWWAVQGSNLRPAD